MSWTAFHSRGETLHAVVDAANDRRDGILPMQVPGVAENFSDEIDLVGALLLKWHARLSGNIERALVREPMDLEGAVAAAWRATAEQLPGVRLVIDRCLFWPETPAMEAAMQRAREKEWLRLAAAAGLASGQSPAALAAGRRVEEHARAALPAGLVLHASRPAAAPQGADGTADTPDTAQTTRTTQTTETAEVAGDEPRVTESFVDRIRAVLAA